MVKETKLDISDDFRIAMNEAQVRSEDIKFATKNICRAVKTYVDRVRHLFGDGVALIAVRTLDDDITKMLIERYKYEQSLYENLTASFSVDLPKFEDKENESD